MPRPATTIAVDRVVAPRQRTEADDPDRSAEQVVAALCRQDAIDDIGAIELVGDPCHVCATGDRPPEAPKALSEDNQRVVRHQPSQRHSGTHHHMCDNEHEPAADRVGQHARRHLGDDDRHALEHADKDELGRR